MADTEFEEFRQTFDGLPQYIKAPTSIYALVHDVNLDEDSPSTMSSSINEDFDPSSVGLKSTIQSNGPIFISNKDTPSSASSSSSSSSSASTITPTTATNTLAPASETITTMIADNELIVVTAAAVNAKPSTSVVGLPLNNGNSISNGGQPPLQQRRRRRLPEIPKNKKSTIMSRVQRAQPSLADELGAAFQMDSKVSSPPPASSHHHHHSSGPPVHFAIGGHTRSLLLLKCHQYLRDEDSSPDSERFQSTDVDSGNSTVHSPDGPKSTSPPLISNQGFAMSPSTPTSSALSLTNLELLEATHRGLHKFIPRHRDEIEVEIGDPLYVQKEADDLWCEGVNLRTGRQGIFPSAYAVDMDYSDFDPAVPKVKRERYLLGYLGSVETLCHKGTSVLKQAVSKMALPDGTPRHKPHSCILEVSDQGLRMVDRNKPPKDVPCHDYFYALKNVSFCAFHPIDHRYLGFITKHPQVQRFACHVFVGNDSTRPIAESVGRAMQRFYTAFIEQAFPIEDIYIE